MPTECAGASPRGPNTGKPNRTWGGSGESQGPEPSARRCANVDGSSVHANVSLPAHQRAKLENLCRYACAQLQLVPIDGENFRRGCAGMSTLRRPDAYSCRYRRSLCRSQDSRLSRPALTATPGCSRSPEPTPRNRRIVMAKRATFAEVCLRPVQCFILLRQSCVFKFVCARKTPAQHRPMQSCAWNRVFHHSRPNNSKIGSGWKTAFISPMLARNSFSSAHSPDKDRPEPCSLSPRPVEP